MDALRDLVELVIVVDETFDQNCYVIHRRDTDDVLLIDPGLQYQQTLELLDENNWHCSQVLLTHGHPDHVSGVPAVKAAHNCDVAIHPDDRPLLNAVLRLPLIPRDMPPVVCDSDLAGEQIVSWQGLNIHVSHIPGHTPGSVCFLMGPDVMSGDTLFYRAVGRTDLPGGSWDALLFSIENVLYTLPPETVVYPGHGQKTTIGEERTHNPFVIAKEDY